WAFEDSGEISSGGKVFKSVIRHFVEKQSYVEYIKDFKMMHGEMHEDLSTIESQTPISILVPEARETMNITYLYNEDCISDQLLNKSGLGYENLEDTKIYD